MTKSQTFLRVIVIGAVRNILRLIPCKTRFEQDYVTTPHCAVHKRSLTSESVGDPGLEHWAWRLVVLWPAGVAILAKCPPPTGQHPPPRMRDYYISSEYD